MGNPVIFALNATQELGSRIGRHLGMPLAEHEEREFEDGEHKARPLATVRGQDVYVIQSLYADRALSANDKLLRLLFFIGALKDAAAERVTAVVPYLCYARKDRKTQPDDPVTTQYVARLFESVGTDRIAAMDVHNLAAFQNAFRCRTEHLEANPLFIRHLLPQLGSEDIIVVSPDAGGMKRAERFRQMLGDALQRPIAAGIAEKYRARGIVSGEMVMGDIAGKTVMIIDDLISTGGTLARVARACRAKGARKVIGMATHGLFVGEASVILASDALDQVIVTDTVPPFRVKDESARRKLQVLDCAPLIADAIRLMHIG